MRVGGALADMGVHAIDTARYLLGDPEPQSVYMPKSPLNTATTMSMTAVQSGSIGKVARLRSSNPAGGGPTQMDRRRAPSFMAPKHSASCFRHGWKSLIARRRRYRRLTPGIRQCAKSTVRKSCTTFKCSISSTAFAKTRRRIPVATKAWSICALSTPRWRAAAAAKSFTFDSH